MGKNHLTPSEIVDGYPREQWEELARNSDDPHILRLLRIMEENKILFERMADL